MLSVQCKQKLLVQKKQNDFHNADFPKQAKTKHGFKLTFNNLSLVSSEQLCCVDEVVLQVAAVCCII